MHWPGRIFAPSRAWRSDCLTGFRDPHGPGTAGVATAWNSVLNTDT